MDTQHSEPRLYIADLAAYNSGYLHGIWIDACDDLEEIQDAVKAMLEQSPVSDAEEYAIHDYEGFNGYEISEYENIKTAHNIAQFIEAFPSIGGALLNYTCGDIDDARKIAEEDYCGCYQSLADYAQELTEETSDIPKHLELYIDYKKMGRDMDMSGDIFTIDAGYQEVHIFWNH